MSYYTVDFQCTNVTSYGNNHGKHVSSHYLDLLLHEVLFKSSVLLLYILKVAWNWVLCSPLLHLVIQGLDISTFVGQFLEAGQ